MSFDSDPPEDISTLDGDFRIGSFVVRPLLKQVVPLPDGAGVEERGEHGTPRQPVRLPDKALGVLFYLAQNARQVCRRDEILDAVWGLDREAYDRVLDNAIRDIRKALGDDARNPEYVQTIPKKGYRLLVPVEPRPLATGRDASGEAVPYAASSGEIGRKAQTVPAPGDSGRAVILGAVAVILALATTLFWFHRTSNDPTISVAIEVAPETRKEAVGTENLVSLAPFEQALHRALFDQHACAERSLFRPAYWPWPSELQIRLRREPSSDARGNAYLMAELHPEPGRAVALQDVTNPIETVDTTAESFAQQVVQSLDLVACHFDGADNAGRACHCLQNVRTFEGANMLESALERVQLALALDPTLTSAYADLAWLHQFAGHEDRGLSALTSGLATIEHPDSTEALRLRLSLARLHHDADQEARLLEELKEREPEETQWQLEHAMFRLHHEQDCEAATEVARRVLDGDSLSENKVLPSTWILWRCGETRRVVDLVTKHVEARPRERALRGWGVTVLTSSGQYELASEYAKELMALAPATSEPFWLLARLHERQGHYVQAESWYETAREASHGPKRLARASAGLARLAWLQGDFERCLNETKDIPNAIYMDVGESPLWVRGLCLASAGRLDEARDVLGELADSPEARSAASWLSSLSLLQAQVELAGARSAEDRQRAADLFVKAARAQPLIADFIFSEAARGLRQAGDVERAETWFRRTLDLNPNHPRALCGLGQLQLDRGDVGKARRNLRRGLEIFGTESTDLVARSCREAFATLEPGTQPEESPVEPTA